MENESLMENEGLYLLQTPGSKCPGAPQHEAGPTKKFETSHVGGATCRTPPIPRSAADGDCSHEIKRRLLLGREVMTNLDSILKSRDIMLSIKVRLVKVFPVVMYGCESWTIKKAEC